MVRRFIIIIALVHSYQVSANRPVFDSESLKARMESSSEDQQRASARLKASRGDTKSLRLLNREDITYKLPDGRYVPGILLPNGKVAPSIVAGRERVPACVTSDYRLVPGSYHARKEVINCDLKEQELAILEGDVANQVSTVSPTDQDSEASSDNTEVRSSNKYGGGSTNTAAAPAAKSKPSPAQDSGSASSRSGSGTRTAYSPQPAVYQPPANSSIYVPPMRNTSQSRSVGAVMSRDESKFGIPIGTWVNAKLMRRVSSAEGGQIEFLTLDDIEGKYQTLPEGTVLFARKQINEASRRLESVSVTARLPDGREIQGVNFRVHSLDQTAGLSGQLIRDREGELANAGANALLNAAGSVALNAGDQATGGLAGGVRDDLIQNEQRNMRRRPKAVIEVAPQEVLLQAVKGF